jgi:hypothetical protein
MSKRMSCLRLKNASIVYESNKVELPTPLALNLQHRLLPWIDQSHRCGEM